HVTLIRSLLFDSKEEKQLAKSACDDAEMEVREVLRLTKEPKDANARTYELVGTAKKKMWTKLYHGMQQRGELRGNRFGGFLEFSPKSAWTPTLASIPFQKGTYGHGGVKLVGPRGTMVKFMPAFTYSVV